MVEQRELTIAERRAILDQEVASYAQQGYLVLSRSDTTAQLVKPKRFSCLWAFVWLLVTIFLLGIGMIIYWIWHASKKNKGLYLEVDLYGNVTRIESASTD